MAEEEDQHNEQKKLVRIYFDGCFDCFHFGHANALRQAREMGDVLVVGIHSDSDIQKHKGRPPVYPESERYRMIRAIKWVDEVVEGATYLPDVDLLEKYHCDFCVHGDDKSFNADGGDSYRLLKAAGRYRECRRTDGISTTDIIKRLLLKVEELAQVNGPSAEPRMLAKNICCNNSQNIPANLDSSHKFQQFFLTSKFLTAFSSGAQPKVTDRVVYVAGDFDLFHIGHLELLEKTRKEGDYLLVGIHSDDVVRSYHGNKFPVMTLLERTLSVLACRHVSEVIIGAPMHVTMELMERYHVDVVCHERSTFPADFPISICYADPISQRKFKLLGITSDVTTITIMDRIKCRRMEYESKYHVTASYQ